MHLAGCCHGSGNLQVFGSTFSQGSLAFSLWQGWVVDVHSLPGYLERVRFWLPAWLPRSSSWEGGAYCSVFAHSLHLSPCAREASAPWRGLCESVHVFRYAPCPALTTPAWLQPREPQELTVIPEGSFLALFLVLLTSGSSAVGLASQSDRPPLLLSTELSIV